MNLEKKIKSYSEFIIKFRWLVLPACILLTFICGYGIKNIVFETDYRIFFSEKNPNLIAFENLQNTYSRNDVVQFVIKPNEGDIFNSKTLESIRKLTRDSWQIPYSTRVDSIGNFQNTYAIGDELVVEDLIPLNTSLNSNQIDNIKSVALNEPIIKDLLISKDGKTTAVSATITLPKKSNSEIPEIMAKVRDLKKEFLQNNPNHQIEITGNIALNNAFIESTIQDSKTLFPLMYLALLVFLGLFLKSISSVFIILGVILFSLFTGIGIGGWSGLNWSTPAGTSVIIIMTLAIADAVHILTTTIKNLRKGLEKKQALMESMRINFGPVFLTSLTTIIGFLSLNFSDAPPFNDLGNFSALGVGAAWLFSITLLPAMVMILPFKFKKIPENQTPKMELISNFIVINTKKLFYSTLCIAIILITMIPKIELNDQFVEYFDESLEFRQSAEFALENLTGIYRAEWSIPSGDPNGITDPNYLKKLESFVEFLNEQEGVVHVSSVTNIFKRLNKNMNQDDPEYYKLPENKNLAAQYLLLYEMSLPLGLDLTNQINVDKSATRVVATLENITTRDLSKLDDITSKWLNENFNFKEADEYATKSTGSFPLFAYITQRNINLMLIGTTTALVLISAILFFALKSWKLGLISLIPNLFPAGMAFGVWAIFFGEIGLAASVITATSLGIIVDDTVHFLSKYKRAKIENNLNTDQALNYAFNTVGPALIITTLVLIIGFSIISLSSFNVNASLGQLTALAVFFALFTDFLLLPGVLKKFDKTKKEQS